MTTIGRFCAGFFHTVMIIIFTCLELFFSPPWGKCISVNNSLSVITGAETRCWNYQEGHLQSFFSFFPYDDSNYSQSGFYIRHISLDKSWKAGLEGIERHLRSQWLWTITTLPMRWLWTLHSNIGPILKYPLILFDIGADLDRSLMSKMKRHFFLDWLNCI